MTHTETVDQFRAAITDAGTSFIRRDQTYTVIDVKPHTRRDGVASSVYTLNSNCVTCGVEFDSTAGPVALADKQRSLTRRCPSCRPKRKAPGPRCATCGQRLPVVKS